MPHGYDEGMSRAREDAENAPDLPRGRFSRIAAPLNRWRRLTGLEQYLVYARWSLIGSLPFLAVPVLAPLSTRMPGPFSPSERLVALVLGALCVATVALSCAALERHPDLNSAAHKPYARVFALSGLIAATLWVMGAALFLSHMSMNLQLLGVISLWAGTMVISYVHAAWLRHHWIIVIVLSAVTTWMTAPILRNFAWLWFFFPLFFLSVTLIVLWTVRVLREADRAQRLEAELSLTEERLRIAQELHDTMGQHLAAMSLKSQVALALAERDDPRLEKELHELYTLTHTSAKDMREVVRGYRDINLATEVAGARTLLEKAGIHVTIIGTSLDIPQQYRDIAAWCVREATTNILRHAHATRATLAFNNRGMRVVNNGVTKPIGPPSGLGSLRRRAERVGASIETAVAQGEFSAELTFPDAVGLPLPHPATAPPLTSPPPRDQQGPS